MLSLKNLSFYFFGGKFLINFVSFYYLGHGGDESGDIFGEKRVSGLFCLGLWIMAVGSSSDICGSFLTGECDLVGDRTC